MFMQIFSTLFIGGFITLAVIGLAALFHAVFFRSAEPVPQGAEHLWLAGIAERDPTLSRD